MKVGDLVRTKGNDGAFWLVIDTDPAGVKCRSIHYASIEVWFMNRTHLEVISESR